MSIKLHNNNLYVHLKALEQQEGIIPKKSKWEKMNKPRVEIKIIETNQIYHACIWKIILTK